MADVTESPRERRCATVLFADLSGFTRLSEGLDPEDVTDITSEIFHKFEAIIKSYDGHLDKTMGDAVMAVFGAPTAHEDDPVRAIHCALEMQEAIAAFNAKGGSGVSPLRVEPVSLQWFDRDQPVSELTGNLPHWRQEGVTYFVTFRLADSLPQEKLAQWRSEREAWLRCHPEPHDEAARREYCLLFPDRLQEWLDEGLGESLFSNPELCKTVESALRHFDGDRYRLDEFVVMPNHVHVLVTPLGGHELSEVLHSWKSFTAHEVNKRLGRNGELWQKESFDHIIRSAAHMERVRQYIRDNPSRGSDKRRDVASTLQMRVGINTGEIVTGRPTEKEAYTVVGDAVNVAQRLESIAKPGTVLVGRETRKLADERFIFLMLAAAQVKNRAEPVQPYEVTGVRDIKALQTRRILLRAAMVGRDREMMRLKAAFAAARDGRTSRCVVVTGEAGEGKSRLLYEFDQWITDEPYLVMGLRGRCMPYGGAPLAPFREMIRGEFGIRAGMDPAECRKRLTDGMTARMAPLVAEGRIRAGYEEENLIHLVGLMVGVEFPEARILSLPIDRRREEGFHAIRMLMEAFVRIKPSDETGRCGTTAPLPADVAAQAGVVQGEPEGGYATQPFVLMIEDMHWADESTAALLAYLIEKLKEQPVLFLAAARNQIDERPFARTLLSNATVERVKLSELGKGNVAALVEKLMGAPADETLLSEIEHRTAGNPYFVEEIVRFAMEKGIAKNEDGKWRLVAAGGAGASPAVLPDTLDGLLVARIDGLPAGAREAIRSASVIGRFFWERAVEELAQRVVTGELDVLKRSELIYRRPGSILEGEAEHVFKHMLLRDAAYRTLSKKERPALHGKVADWIEQRLEGAPGELVQLAAYHNTEAGRSYKALKHWERAGDLAKEAAQLDESLNCYTAAIQIVGTMKDTVAHGNVPLLERRADVYGLKGDLDRAMADLEEGLRLLGVSAQTEAAPPNGSAAKDRAHFLIDLAWHRQTRGEVEEARRLLALALQHVEGMNVPEEVAALHRRAWLEGMGVCNYDEGERLSKKAIEVAQRIPAENISKNGRDALVDMCRATLGALAGRRGQFPVAEKILLEVLPRFVERGERGNVANALGNLGIVYFNMGKFDLALEFHGKNLEMNEQTGNRAGVAQAACNTGVVYSKKGELDRALECFRKFLKTSEQTGDRRSMAAACLNIGGVHHEKGEIDRALEFYGRCLETSEQIGYKGGVANASGSIGRVYYERGEIDRAMECHKKQLEINEHIGNRRGVAEASCNIASVRQARGDKLAKDGHAEEARKEWNEALHLAKTGLSIAEAIGFGGAAAAGHECIGKALWAMGEKPRGLEELKLALAKYDEIGMKSGEIDELRARISEREALLRNK